MYIIAGFVDYKNGALDSQPQVIKFTSYLPMVDGYLRGLRLLPPLQLVAMIAMYIIVIIGIHSLVIFESTRTLSEINVIQMI
jgi:hypothetical protein